MIHTLSVSGYRSLREITIELGQLTLVTGTNGSGKSSLYRTLRLLADVAQGRSVASLAREGGLASTLWAGPERFSQAMKEGRQPIQGTVRSGPVALKLGFSGDDFGYAIDLGLPTPSRSRFSNDPEVKVEALWSGPRYRRACAIAERRGPLVSVRTEQTGEWREAIRSLSSFDSMVTHCADPADGLELLQLRESMRRWRFYDALRTDRDSPARQPGIGTFTPVLADDGGDLASAIQTIFEIGERDDFDASIADAFDGATIEINDRFEVEMRQPGLLRPLGPTELSDGTLRYLLLSTALHTPRPPDLMILNEPEASLHPDLLAPLARLLERAARHCQLIVVTHANVLVSTLGRSADARAIVLEKRLGETIVANAPRSDWQWPTRT